MIVRENYIRLLGTITVVSFVYLPSVLAGESPLRVLDATWGTRPIPAPYLRPTKQVVTPIFRALDRHTFDLSGAFGFRLHTLRPEALPVINRELAERFPTGLHLESSQPGFAAGDVIAIARDRGGKALRVIFKGPTKDAIVGPVRFAMYGENLNGLDLDPKMIDGRVNETCTALARVLFKPRLAELRDSPIARLTTEGFSALGVLGEGSRITFHGRYADSSNPKDMQLTSFLVYDDSIR